MGCRRLRQPVGKEGNMQILELWLRRYGKFEDHRIRLKSGVNIIYGGNETGKTTIHSFIRAMCFGLNRARGRAARTDEYQLRQPWDAPGIFLGTMWVQKDGETYRIDRCFDRSAKPLTVTCESQPQEFALPEQAMAELLDGISENAFVNTVFIPQAHAETEEALAAELQRYMINSDNALDAQLDVTRALQSLRKKKKALEQKKKKEEEALEAAIEKNLAKAEDIRRELELLERQSTHMRRQEETGRARSRFGYETDEGYGEDEAEGSFEAKIPHWKKVIIGLLVLAGILALAGAVFLTDWKLRIFLGIFGAVFLALTIPAHFLFRTEEPDEMTEKPEIGHLFEKNDRRDRKNERRKNGVQGMTKVGDVPDTYFQEEIAVRKERYAKLQDELEGLYQKHVRPVGVETELAAVTMAIDRICELSTGIYARSGGRLNERASEILNELTNGAYNRITLDESMEVRIYTPERVLGLHQVSGGTMQQIYFALRMAAGELLGGAQLPVVLDETFAMYDDVRLASALRFLKKSGRQVILFTCQKREREILESL